MRDINVLHSHAFALLERAKKFAVTARGLQKKDRAGKGTREEKEREREREGSGLDPLIAARRRFARARARALESHGFERTGRAGRRARVPVMQVKVSLDAPLLIGRADSSRTPDKRRRQRWKTRSAIDPRRPENRRSRRSFIETPRRSLPDRVTESLPRFGDDSIAG